MKSFLQFGFEAAKVIVIALLVVVPLRAFVFEPFLVRGDSMVPNYHNGDYLLVDKLSYRFSAPERGDVIVLEFPFDRSQKFLKRIVGLPGQEVEVQDGKVLLYDKDGAAAVLNESSYLPETLETPGSVKIQLREGEYFVLGDNRPASSDSRKWGALEEQLIVGRVFFNIFSLGSFFQDIVSPESI